MKVLLLVLLLANLLFFGAVRGWLGDGMRAAVLPEEREPSRSAQQVAPERVELLLPEPAPSAGATEPAAAGAAQPAAPRDGAAVPAPVAPAGSTSAAPAAVAAPGVAASAAPSAAVASAGTAPAAVAASAAASTASAGGPITAPGGKPAAPGTPPASAPNPAATKPTALAAVAPLACLELGGLTADDAKRIAERVTSGRLAAQASVHPAAEASTWMVYLPARASRAEAERAAADLRAKGFDDFFVIQDNSPMRNAISLGVFRSEEGARSRVAALAARNIAGAQVLARSGSVPRARVEAREVRPDARPELERMAREFPGIDWRECAPAHKG